MRAGVAVGFGIGAALVLWAFLRQHSTAVVAEPQTWERLVAVAIPSGTGEQWVREMGVH